jgi:CRP-like cAMP-binding protein
MEEKKINSVHSSFWSNVFYPAPNKADLKKYLNTLPLFSQLNKRELSHLISIIHNRNYLLGEYIFHQGEPGIGLYIILDGRVIIQRVLANQEIITLASLVENEFFGELALVDGEKRSASAIAETDCKLAVIFKPDLDEFIEKHPKPGVKILQAISTVLTERLRNLNEDYISELTKSKIKKGSEHGT